MARVEAVELSGLNAAGIRVPRGVEVSWQVYESDPRPLGVEVVKTPVFSDGQGGHFLEIGRFSGSLVRSLLEKGIGLDLREGQVNTAVVAPGTERFGHLHRDQDEFWMVASGTLTVALMDIRKGVQTEGVKSKLVFSPGTGLFIPHGVVHGLANYGRENAVLVYLADHHFSPREDTQEWRAIPKDPRFWDFAKPENY